MRGHPAVGLVASLQVQLLIIVCEGFGEFSAGAVLREAERDGFCVLADEAAHEGEFLFGSEVAQDFIALAGYLYRDLIGHGGGRRAGAGGVGEDVQVGEGQFCDETAGGFEFGGGFAGESGHDVGADGGGGQGGANLFNLFAIVPGTIFAVHAAEYGVTAGLQGDMRVFGNARRGGEERDEFGSPIHGLDGGDAQFFELGLVEDGGD
jgi:hypothetical protein